MGEHSKEAVARRCVFDVAAAHHFLLGTHFSGEYRSSSAVIRSDSSLPVRVARVVTKRYNASFQGMVTAAKERSSVLPCLPW